MQTVDRRKDQRTAELIGIAVLTRDAFGIGRAHRYAILAGLSGTLTANVLARPRTALRRAETLAGRADRRQPSEHADAGGERRCSDARTSPGLARDLAKLPA
ncbi:hypothetical protein [Pseudoduganella albidiflava]|uniref:Uncharacterized protein n=1 Tax=Pseudoduganella albidiflava TaxID=321983 RepID=A0A411X0C2_9BURK|nr:hypothetical protein [Pseudoduganella albidiflava]QBI02410.1 hypothetical protein EYF70_17340 [Pseudoduganella albidiflava]GGY43059.1 hypothetical protein GCM10007387_26370 [Pseudoduganella albidiflava]